MRRALLLTVIALAACTGAGGQSAASDEGRAEKRNFAVAAFDKVDLGGSSEVVIRTGAQPSVRAEGSAEALDRLEIEVDGDTLRIGQKDGRWGLNFSKAGRTKVFVTVPTLKAAAVGGSGNIEVDKVQGEAFDGSIAGSGNLRLAALQVAQAKFSIAGSGGIRAAGSAEDIKLDIAGSGDLDLAGVRSKVASVSIAGSGNATANASDSASIAIMGSGNVKLSGTAKCSINKMGSGSAECGA